MNRNNLFVFLIAVALLGCLKRQEFPAEPTISLKSFDIAEDSANLFFTFTDGDGNFGLKDEDFPDTSFCPRNNNVYCEYFELQNGMWTFIDINPCENPNAVPFYYRVPFVAPTGQFKAQEGEVKITMYDWYLDSPFDTCKFEIRAVDYDQNLSNTIQTQVFVKP